MKTADRIEVFLDGKKVGTIAPYQKRLTAFEYSAEWLENGFSISPFSLPLQSGVKIAKADPFDGIFGIFADSLPDGWGRLLVDRILRKSGENPEETDQFSRLSIVGTSGKGALEYKPVCNLKNTVQTDDLDLIAAECRKILQSEDSGDLDTLFAMGGSSGGARPKVTIRLDGEEWIVKFPSSGDPADIGLMEYEYNLCARDCGIDIPGIRLFPSSTSSGYFGCKRFDRIETPLGEKKIHTASVSALLETSHRIPALDYCSLLSLTWQLTKQTEEVEKMFTLMCFNVFAHNRDDHSNNFSFVYDGSWQLSPAYDLTYSNSVGGEHATTVAGEGKNPTIKDILTVAKKIGLKESAARQIAGNVEETVKRRLGGIMKKAERL
ncbi:type II toxin-antitoxin system HipA family toxin [bacterium]|nr:type II toxin-antitoxin system HipA family toxin [bacterium]